MIDRLNQPPNIRLSIKSCEQAYELYRSNSSTLFTLPTFEERFPGRLEGILGSIRQTFETEYLMPTLGECAAAYFVKICTQHPFRDGNKRMAVFYTDIFLWLNGVDLHVDYRYMYELAKFVVLEKEKKEDPRLLQEICMKVFQHALEISEKSLG